MVPPAFIAFTPVPLRTRADGWSPALQLAFIHALADGAKPGEAARALGKNRQNAYALRRRPGAESFAAAWDAAVAYARRRRIEGAAEQRQERQRFGRDSSLHGKPNLPHLPRETVAFRRGPLRLGPC
ncbi:MAG: hypothetical protein JO013_11265 [Alphaproteobacteria bacterium]|nr:hypothetical protein [Alphaproteobacteria bacterium]